MGASKMDGAILQTWRNTVGPSASMCSFKLMPGAAYKLVSLPKALCELPHIR
jgi:hypothetical protein